MIIARAESEYMKKTLSKETIQMLSDYNQAVILVQIPISLRMDDEVAFTKYESRAVTLAQKFQGNLTGGGHAIGGKYYDMVFNFDHQLRNSESAKKFIAAYKRKFPKHKIASVWVSFMGGQREYLSPRDVSRFLKQG